MSQGPVGPARLLVKRSMVTGRVLASTAAGLLPVVFVAASVAIGILGVKIAITLGRIGRGRSLPGYGCACTPGTDSVRRSLLKSSTWHPVISFGCARSTASSMDVASAHG